MRLLRPDHTDADKDEILRTAFNDLRRLNIDCAWTTSAQPYTALKRECISLLSDPVLRENVQIYLRRFTVVRRSVEMLNTFIAMAARADWASIPEDDVRAVAARGWFLGRWLPTFLIIDGPVGSFLNSNDDPFTITGTVSPVIDCVRQFMQHRDFRLLRNGFAHWSFHWEVVGNESYVIAYDRERDLPTIKLHQREADAFHIAAYSIVKVLGDTLLAD